MREFTIYCDESDRDGTYFENFYGGALVQSTHLDLINKKLSDVKIQLNAHRELKWTRVSENYLEKYIQFIDVFFDFVAANQIKIRVMFTQRLHKPVGLTAFHREHEYFLLYFEFIKHSFGLRFSNPDNQILPIRVYCDRLPDTDEKCEQFKSRIISLSLYAPFRKCNVRFNRENIAEIDSSHHPILQGLDIVLGSMAFRLNEKHRAKLPGSKSRGKRTVAKEKLYKHILRRIKEIYPGFNIGVSTGTKMWEDHWNHAYRHWRFKPTNYEIQAHLSKNSQKKAPSKLHK